MGTSRCVRVAVATGMVLGIWCGVGPAADRGESAVEGPKEVGIRGEVARGASESSCVIKVCFGKKKVVAYEVAPESPRGRDVEPLLGKTVEATGVMRKGPHGENVIVVTAVAEAPAQR